MDFIVYIPLFLIISFLFWLKLKTRTSEYAVSALVTSKDVQNVWKALTSTGSEGSFAVFLLPLESSQEESTNIQFSIENGKPGVDWVLLSPTNIRDKNQFIKEAKLVTIQCNFLKKS